MCICFFEVAEPNQPYRFRFCGNRDEFYNRPSVPMHEWKSAERGGGVIDGDKEEEKRTVFAGRDALRGGTWLGISFVKGKPDSYRFAVVHNVRHSDAVDASKQSRGDLVSNFLLGAEDAKTYAEIIGNKGQEYLGFTLVLLDAEGCYFVSNRAPSSIVNDSNNHTHAVTIRKLKPGIYGLTNSLLDTPWPKLVVGKAKFARALTSSTWWKALVSSSPHNGGKNRNAAVVEARRRYETDLMRSLVREVLCDATRFPENLPRILSPDREICLSSIFIEPYIWDRSGFYGTRMQSLVFVRDDGTIVCRERSLDTDSPIKNWIGRWNVTTREFILCNNNNSGSSTTTNGNAEDVGFSPNISITTTTTTRTMRRRRRNEGDGAPRGRRGFDEEQQQRQQQQSLITARSNSNNGEEEEEEKEEEESEAQARGGRAKL